VVRDLLGSFFPFSSLVTFDAIGRDPRGPNPIAFMRPAISGVSPKAIHVHVWASGSKARYFLKSNLHPEPIYDGGQDQKKKGDIGFYRSDEKSIVDEGAIPRNIDMPNGGL
jgi:hypothetical protein